MTTAANIRQSKVNRYVKTIQYRLLLILSLLELLNLNTLIGIFAIFVPIIYNCGVSKRYKGKIGCLSIDQPVVHHQGTGDSDIEGSIIDGLDLHHMLTFREHLAGQPVHL